NLSNFLLNSLGLSGKVVADTTFGRKKNLSFRHLTRFVVIDETSILAERSPVESGQRGDIVLDRSVFRLMLTGADDSAIAPLVDDKTLKASKATRLALVDELIGGIDAELLASHRDPVDLQA